MRVRLRFDRNQWLPLVLWTVSGLLLALITPTNQQHEPTTTAYNDTNPDDNIAAKSIEFIEATVMNTVEAVSQARRTADSFVKSVPYIRTSIPMRIYECLRTLSVLRCTKLYLLEKIDERRPITRSGNLTSDFINQFFGPEEQMGSLINEKYAKMSEKELNQRLVIYFRRFFQNRDIKLHFLPHVLVRVVPSKENKLKFSLKKKKIMRHTREHFTGRSASEETKKDTSMDVSEENSSMAMDMSDLEEDGSMKKHSNRKKHKHEKQSSYKHTMLQMAVPVMLMPAILMGSFLPFVLPMLKMATFMALMMNNSAFIAALIYAARTHINSQEEQHISYHPGYH